MQTPEQIAELIGLMDADPIDLASYQGISEAELLTETAPGNVAHGKAIDTSDYGKIIYGPEKYELLYRGHDIEDYEGQPVPTRILLNRWNLNAAGKMRKLGGQWVDVMNTVETGKTDEYGDPITAQVPSGKKKYVGGDWVADVDREKLYTTLKGSDKPIGRKDCPECGASVIPKRQGDSTICPECGAHISMAEPKVWLTTVVTGSGDRKQFWWPLKEKLRAEKYVKAMVRAGRKATMKPLSQKPSSDPEKTTYIPKRGTVVKKSAIEPIKQSARARGEKEELGNTVGDLLKKMGVKDLETISKQIEAKAAKSKVERSLQARLNAMLRKKKAGTKKQGTEQPEQPEQP